MALSSADTTAIGSLAGTGAGALTGNPMVAMLGGSAGGALGSLFGKKNYNKEALELLRQAQERIMAIPQPTAEDLRLVLQPLVQQGVIEPEDYQTIMQKPSEFLNINIDPTGRDAEIGALNELQNIVDQGGMDAMFRSGMQEATNAQNMNLRGQRDAILQNAAERGALNSNLTVADQLARASEDAYLANSSTNQIAADAEMRALQALMAKADLGGKVTAQDFAQEQAKAQAIDAINRFNAENSQSQANLNTGTRNQAQATNLALKQDIANANVGTVNDQARYNANLPQQIFQNKLQQAGAAAGVSVPMANLSSQGEQARAATQGNLLGNFGQTLGNYATNQNLYKTIQPQQNQYTPVQNDAYKTGVANFAGKNGYSFWEGGKIPSFEEGGEVPGEAPFPGDNPMNDTVVARLSPGEIVIPRSEVNEMEQNEPSVEDVQKVLEALTGLRNNYWKGGKVGRC